MGYSEGCKHCSRITSTSADHEKSCPHYSPSLSERYDEINSKWDQTTKTFDSISNMFKFW